MVTGQNDVNLNLPISTVLLGSAAIFGICIGVGNKLYERYISTMVKPKEVMPPVQEIDMIEIKPDVIIHIYSSLIIPSVISPPDDIVYSCLRI